MPRAKGEPLALGTATQWGEISAVGMTMGERYYWMTAKDGSMAMMPGDVVEAALSQAGTR